MKNLCIYLLLLAVFTGFKSQGQEVILNIQKSDIAPVIDGVIAEEWTDANEVNFIGKTDTQVKAKVKYDRENLYIVFLNLINSNNVRRNAEVMIDTDPGGSEWDKNCYWFHASYSNCAAEGEYYNWEDCAMDPSDWKANTFPFEKDNNNIEFKISFKKLHLTPTTNTRLRIALKLSDPLEIQTYWPATAIISDPSTWGFLSF